MENHKECLKLLSSHRNYIEIAFLISHGLSNKNIAHALNLSDRTVSTHRSAIFKIVGCANSLGLVGWAVEKNIKNNPDLLMRFDKTLFADKSVRMNKTDNKTKTMDEIKISGEVVRNKKLFRNWFVETYFQKFSEKPLIVTKIDLRMLRDMEQEKEKGEIGQYMKEVAHVASMSLFGMDLSNAVLGKGRTKNVVLVRKTSLYIVCTMLKFSKYLAAELIGRDRTTVLHHCKTMNGFLKVDKTFRMKFEQILKELGEKGLVTYKCRNEEGKIFRNK